MPPVMIPASDLLNDPSVGREFILLAGKDGTGKTCALLSLAEFVEQLTPDNSVWVIDTENKFAAAVKANGRVPANLKLYLCETMNDVTEAANEILASRAPGDWVFVESAGRVWERAQDIGYQVITGTAKAAYMERRRTELRPDGKQLPVTPRPDDLWSIIKGAHDTEFLDRLMHASDLQVVISTGVARVKEKRGNQKENPDRVDFRAETGIDLNLEGAPRLPYYALTGVLLERERGKVYARVWRDSNSLLDDPAVTFEVPNKKSFAAEFWAATGR